MASGRHFLNPTSTIKQMTGVRSALWFRFETIDRSHKDRGRMMQEIPKSAAASIWPNLRQGTPAPVEQRPQLASVAAAMYPQLVPQPPKPLTQSEVKAAWLDRLMGMSRIRRR